MGRYRRFLAAKFPVEILRQGSWRGQKLETPHAEALWERAQSVLCKRDSFPHIARYSTQLLALLDFGERFAVDTERGRGPGLQPLNADLDAAGIAISVIVIL